MREPKNEKPNPSISNIKGEVKPVRYELPNERPKPPPPPPKKKS